MRILLADDHDLVREAIAAFLVGGGVEVVDQAETLDGAISLVEGRSADVAPYDVILLDFGMPGMSGLEGLQKMKAAAGGAPVALISGTANRAVAEEALSMGAAGFVPKTMAASSLVNAVRFMASGEQYAPVKWMTEVVDEPTNPLAAKLSDREMQVLGGLCRGASNKEIARELDLQEVTIKLHVKTLCRKLEAKNRTQAALIAKEAGLF